MRKKYLFTLLIFSFIVIIILGLNFSDRFNDFIFSIVNPYDPLVSKISKSENSQASFSETNVSQTKSSIFGDSITNVSQIINKIVDNNEYWKDPRGLFPIFAYNVPDSTNDLTASLKIIEHGGINIIINSNLSWMPGPFKLKTAFQNLGDTDLRLLTILVNECRDDFIFGNSNNETNTHISKYLNEFNENYIYGWYIWDEPGRNRKFCSTMNLTPNDDYADINTMVKQIRSDSNLSKKLDYVNLFPDYWDGTPSITDYEKYIDAFITSQEYKPRVLSVDYYPWRKSEFGGFRKNYYSSLDVIRKKSIQNSLPFWMIVLSSGHEEYKNPSIEEISLQVYSALAYGAKGIGYYIYSRSWENDGYKSWILDNYVDNNSVADSLHGPLYVPVKKLNQQVQELGKTLLDLKSVEVIHSSDYPNGQKDISQSILNKDKPDKFIKSITNASELNSDPRVLVGILKEKNAKDTTGIYTLVVNKDVINEAKVNISFQNPSNIFVYNKENGERKFINQSDTLNVTLLPSSGELYYIQ